MTVRRGIIHSEMLAGDGPQKGLQLWINLSSKDKMIEPRYQELLSGDIKRAENDGVKVRVIVGESMGVRSPVYTRTPAIPESEFIEKIVKDVLKKLKHIPSGDHLDGLDWNGKFFVSWDLGLNAFEQNYHIEEYMNLLNRDFYYTKGNPLALKFWIVFYKGNFTNFKCRLSQHSFIHYYCVKLDANAGINMMANARLRIQVTATKARGTALMEDYRS
ncbi:hypothetical protein Ddye_004948 [Dipteronia dyeriana]|uniref:Uncharacterized protein n=1 Tax=Dipteronia dyeriana TaxID=168575 RepID=A0AAD9XFL4_9ROSI|nr:hypothetical protein Ddye_004948 [Dipteronia dyeriana]